MTLVACPAAMAWRSLRISVARTPGMAMLFGVLTMREREREREREIWIRWEHG